MPITKACYVSQIVTYEDYQKFKSSGMAWELFPELPETFEKHEEFVENYLKELGFKYDILFYLSADGARGITKREFQAMLEAKERELGE